MRTYMFLIMALVYLISCNAVIAQPSPIVSKKYSNNEIEKMIEAYKASRQREIYPATNLQQQFMKDFPKARDIDWEMGADVYEVEFEIGHIDYKAYYDEHAALIMYIVELREAGIPAIVKNAAMSKYPNYKFDDVEKVVRGTETFYVIEMGKGKYSEVKTIFMSNGIFEKEIYNKK